VKRKTAKKAARKIAKVAPAAAKAKMLITRIGALETKLDRYVPRTELQSAMARYRMATAEINSKRHQVKLLQAKICDLECRIEELEQKLAAEKTTPT
jgi:predicted RNase H-like nuclease (RuvC/YqgF family)